MDIKVAQENIYLLIHTFELQGLQVAYTVKTLPEPQHKDPYC